MDISELSDIQAESCVIGSLIFHPEYVLNSEGFLKPKHFFNVENGCIYWAINSLVNDGCGLYRGRLILPYEHLSRFQNDLV